MGIGRLFRQQSAAAGSLAHPGRPAAHGHPGRSDYEKLAVAQTGGGRHGEVWSTHELRVQRIAQALQEMAKTGDYALFRSASHQYGAVKLTRNPDGSVAAIAAARGAVNSVLTELRTFGFGDTDAAGAVQAWALHWPEFEIPQLIEHIMTGLLGLPFDFPMAVDTGSES